MSLYQDLLGTMRRAFSIGPPAVRLTLDTSLLTSPRAVVAPDKAGTLAMLSDITGGAVPTGMQASLVVPDHTQMPFRRKIVASAGQKILIGADAVLVGF